MKRYEGDPTEEIHWVHKIFSTPNEDLGLSFLVLGGRGEKHFHFHFFFGVSPFFFSRSEFRILSPQTFLPPSSIAFQVQRASLSLLVPLF